SRTGPRRRRGRRARAAPRLLARPPRRWRQRAGAALGYHEQRNLVASLCPPSRSIEVALSDHGTRKLSSKCLVAPGPRKPTLYEPKTRFRGREPLFRTVKTMSEPGL